METADKRLIDIPYVAKCVRMKRAGLMGWIYRIIRSEKGYVIDHYYGLADHYDIKTFPNKEA